ncbi:hypothetical protein LCGC14_1720830 [marine sediment metagenome]|uniref:Uncharacterized protein n=1 Tax=marine sediment metagenome TaxID=412755 RepID=A0A0F9HCL2_9ZZZZ
MREVIPVCECGDEGHEVGDDAELMQFSTLTAEGIFTAMVCFGHFSIAESDEWLSIYIINERLKRAGYGDTTPTRELVNAAHNNTLGKLASVV